jgi:hypothetical protein
MSRVGLVEPNHGILTTKHTEHTKTIDEGIEPFVSLVYFVVTSSCIDPARLNSNPPAEVRKI